jgi:ABC-2 type transport system permease protein
LRIALEVFRFEIGYQLRRRSILLYALVFAGLSIAAGRVFLLDARSDGYFFNAPIIVAAVTIASSMLALLVIAGIAGDAATRDAEARMDALIHTTPLRLRSWLGGRLAGALAVTALLLLLVPGALLISTFLPGIEPELLGPFRPSSYLASYFVLGLPNAIVATALLFAIAAGSRRAIASYAGAAVLFAMALISHGVIAVRMGEWKLARLLDPLGYTSVFALWRSLNPLQRNVTAAVDETMIANRLLWLAISAVLLGLAVFRLRPLADPSVGRRNAMPAVAEPGSHAIRVTHRIPVVTRHFGTATRQRQLLAIVFRSIRELFASRVWLIVPLVGVIFLITAPKLIEVQLGTPGAATTGRIAFMLGAPENTFLIALFIALAAGELVRRDREQRIHHLVSVTPLPEWLPLAGRSIALAIALMAMQLFFLVICVALQLLHGTEQIDPSLYVAILFGQQLVGYFLLGALGMAIHVLVDQKHVGNILLIVTIVTMRVAEELGVRHNLLRYGGAPEWRLSEMRGVGGEIGAWGWFAFYWSGWALLAGVVAYLFWIRGEEKNFRARMGGAIGRVTRVPALVSFVGIAIIAAAGGWIIYNTTILNRFYTSAEVEQLRAEYEERYGRYEAVDQPVLAGASLRVEFYPSRSSATISGSYRLENRSEIPINAVHVATHAGVATRGISFDRPFRTIHSDDKLGHRIFALAEAIEPGESVQMTFAVAFAARGFTNGGRDDAILPNGSWFEHRGDQAQRNRQWMPAIGYQPSRELDSPAARARHGLDARPAIPPLEDTEARMNPRGVEKIDFEAIVGTDTGETGVAPGRLAGTWEEGGRRYFHYVADAPITNGYAIFSARYAVHRAMAGDVAIEVFHHPSHTQNLDRMVSSAIAALDYHRRNFGPYPYGQLRLVEYPSAPHGLRLTAFPGLIRYSEGLALARPDDDPRGIDLPYAVVAHEVAHQWWGHQLVPAFMEGAPLLSESLAWYGGMMTVEEALGRDHLLRLLSVMRDEYLAPHQTRQVPLLRSFDQLDAYRTGPFAMFALRESVGEDRVNASLRRLLAAFDPAHPPYPSSLDLYGELRASAPESEHDLLKDLFEDVTFWDLRATGAEAREAAGGGQKVSVTIAARKAKADPLGKETDAPMDDAIDLAVFDAHGEQLYRGPHRIRSGEQTIDVMVSGAAPARVSLDPDRVFLDREPANNDTPVVSTGAPR